MPSGGLRTTLILLFIFSAAMGFLESSVVVYLREIYYPEGFAFPLTLAPSIIGTTEVLREAATIIMLILVGILAGKNPLQRFAFFVFCFSLWDIFYYVFLRILIHWPESVFTWDVLFLIPLMWTSPVLAPLIVSATLVLLACMILYFDHRDVTISKGLLHYGLIIAGFFIVFLSLILDFFTFLLKEYPFSALFKPALLWQAAEQYVPDTFNWYLFAGGEMVLLVGLFFLYTRSCKTRFPG